MLRNPQEQCHARDVLKPKSIIWENLVDIFILHIFNLVTKLYALLRVSLGLNSLISSSWAHRHVSGLKMNIATVTTLGCAGSAPVMGDKLRDIAFFQISP